MVVGKAAKMLSARMSNNLVLVVEVSYLLRSTSWGVFECCKCNKRGRTVHVREESAHANHSTGVFQDRWICELPENVQIVLQEPRKLSAV